jgi:hypothetical protein
MTRISWSQNGERYFEAGIDRGVLYIDDDPGIPWVGLVNFNKQQSGGESTPRYLDGIKISNRASPENFEGTLDAYAYPPQFEQCDGTSRFQHGLRITQQRRKPFGMVFRTKIGNEIAGLEKAYKLHILYNLKAEPSTRGYRTLVDQNEPMTLSWKITSRPERISGFRPAAYFIIDSRDIPAELLTQLEDLFYGTETTEATLPTAGELMFLFDSYLDMIYDAGTPFTAVFATYDAGTPSTPVDATIDGGAL